MCLKKFKKENMLTVKVASHVTSFFLLKLFFKLSDGFISIIKLITILTYVATTYFFKPKMMLTSYKNALTLFFRAIYRQKQVQHSENRFAVDIFVKMNSVIPIWVVSLLINQQAT